MRPQALSKHEDDLSSRICLGLAELMPLVPGISLRLQTLMIACRRDTREALRLQDREHDPTIGANPQGDSTRAVLRSIIIHVTKHDHGHPRDLISVGNRYLLARNPLFGVQNDLEPAQGPSEQRLLRPSRLLRAAAAGRGDSPSGYPASREH